MKSGRYNANNYRSILIQKDFNTAIDGKVSQKTYYIHLIVPNGDDSTMRNLNNVAIFFFAIVLLIALVIACNVAGGISKPLSDMKEIVSKIAKGDLSGRLELTQYQEINELVQSYNMMANALQRLYSTLEMQVQDRWLLVFNNGIVIVYGAVGDNGKIYERNWTYPITVNGILAVSIAQMGSSSTTVSGFLCSLANTHMNIKSSVAWISVKLLVLGCI